MGAPRHLVERHILMNLARLASRVAVGGTAAALASAGLVGVSTTSASAAPIVTTYTCTVPGFATPKTFKVSIDLPASLPTLPAGSPIPGGLLKFASVITVPSDVAAAFPTVNGAKSDDFSTALGTSTIKAPVVWTTPGTPNSDGVPISGSGANLAFQLPAAGSYTATAPKAFTLIPTSNGTALPASIP
jgi:hypothetical protein